MTPIQGLEVAEKLPFWPFGRNNPSLDIWEYPPGHIHNRAKSCYQYIRGATKSRIPPRLLVKSRIPPAFFPQIPIPPLIFHRSLTISETKLISHCTGTTNTKKINSKKKILNFACDIFCHSRIYYNRF